MHNQLRRLLDAVWEHDLPIGPFGDFDDRQRAEQEWEETLTVDDCLVLLDWVERPELPPHWTQDHERWLPGLADSAVRHIGRAGRRITDPRITHRFVELLACPDTRSIALDGLSELVDPTVFDTLLCCLGIQSVCIDLCIALSFATDEQFGHLWALSRSAPTAELRKAAAGAVSEWRLVNPKRAIELSAASNGDTDGTLPDQTTLASWRTTMAVALAQQMEAAGDFSAMPILADALQDAGCDNEAMLLHCRAPGPHVCGCWVVDLVLGKE